MGEEKPMYTVTTRNFTSTTFVFPVVCVVARVAM